MGEELVFDEGFPARKKPLMSDIYFQGYAVPKGPDTVPFWREEDKAQSPSKALDLSTPHSIPNFRN